MGFWFSCKAEPVAFINLERIFKENFKFLERIKNLLLNRRLEKMLKVFYVSRI